MPILDIAQNEPAVPPKMPGAVNVPVQSPGNDKFAGPNIPAQQHPNVDGGAASFSSLTNGISELLAAQKAQLSSSVDAFKANVAVDQNASHSLRTLTDDTLNIYKNIEKIQALPGGAKGGLANIISLFNSDYNIGLQTTKIEENQIRANQVTSTAAAIKEQNNALPALMGKVTEAQQANFNAQKDVNNLAIQQGTLEDKRINTQMEFVRLGIMQNKEARDKAEFPYQLKQAQLGVANAELALQKGNREEYEANLTTAMSHLPVDVLSARLNQAMAAGAPMVQFATGKVGKDGKPEMMNVPIPIVQAGLAKNAEIEQKANTAVAADINQKMKIGPTATGIVNGANMFASTDPRAATVVTQTGQIMAALDVNNPSNTRQVGLLIEQQKASLDEIAKSVASKFSTPEAKAAIIAAAPTGKFDAAGGAAVVQDSIGIPSLNTQTLYRGAYSFLNTQLATALKAQNFQGTNNLDPTKAADVQSLMATLLARPEGKQTIKTLTANLLADPTVQKVAARKIGGVIQAKAINEVTLGLSKQQNASPVWKDIVEHSEQFVDRDKDGKLSFSSQKLFQKLEEASVLSHGKINYSDAFLSGLRNYAVNADNSPNSDASYTMYDHALEAAVFGDRPHTAALGDLHYNLRVQAERAHQAMQERIKQDVSGATQRQAVLQSGVEQATIVGWAPHGLDYVDPATIQKKTGIDVNMVPSATGTTLTAEQVKQIYGKGR